MSNDFSELVKKLQEIEERDQDFNNSDSSVDEGIGDWVKGAALAAVLGWGVHAGLDATSAKHSPLGQALEYAAQQGDTEAAKLFKHIDLYADEDYGKLVSWKKRNQEIFDKFKDSVDEGKYKSDAQRKAVHAAKAEKKVSESEGKNPYVCVHAKKGKYECYANTTYGAAKQAADHWNLKGTAGIDVHLADEEKNWSESAETVNEEHGHSMELLMKVVDQMMQDAEIGDYTAIDELLADIPTERLQGYLSLDESANDCDETCPKSCPDCGGTGKPKNES